MWVSPEHLARSFPRPQSRDRLLAKFKKVYYFHSVYFGGFRVLYYDILDGPAI